MVRHRFVFLRAVVVVLGVGFYASLTVLATGCGFNHGEAPKDRSHHHSETGAVDNTLCTWACQAASESAVTPSAPVGSSGTVIAQLACLSKQRGRESFLSDYQTRAPPPASFIAIG
jgi:hypothetical protein